MRGWVLGFAMSALLAGPALAAGDPAAGEAVYAKCKGCHAVGEGAKNKVGPELNELIGRTAGTAPDYKYSKAMADAGAGGLVWTEETLHQFLAKPRDFVKGTKMTFPGLKEQADLDNVIAYLATFSTAPAAGAAAPDAGATTPAAAAPAAQ